MCSRIMQFSMRDRKVELVFERLPITITDPNLVTETCEALTKMNPTGEPFIECTRKLANSDTDRATLRP